MQAPDSPERLIKKIACDIGFSQVGITRLSPCPPSDEVFDRWLKNGKHGEMGYLSRSKEKRRNPTLLLKSAKSAICVALNYYTLSLERNTEIDGSDGRGVFSIYAHGRDYHQVMGEMLSALSERLGSLFPGVETLACVDTMPVSDRAMAIQAGIGWLGKNTCVISPEFGSWVFLGEVLTNLELIPDGQLESLCGSCTLCIESCPTGALDEEYLLDARKCISYLTIEKRGEISKQLRRAMGLHVYGCDECQRICPYNSTPVESSAFKCEERNPLVDMKLLKLARIEDEMFRELTRDSAIERCKSSGMRRNAKIVMDNIRSRGLTEEGKIQ